MLEFKDCQNYACSEDDDGDDDGTKNEIQSGGNDSSK